MGKAKKLRVLRWGHYIERFQPPCPKAAEVHICLVLISCKKQREQRFFNPPSNIRYCGSRVFNTLVGRGAKPRRNPLLALKFILKNNPANSINYFYG